VTGLTATTYENLALADFTYERLTKFQTSAIAKEEGPEDTTLPSKKNTCGSSGDIPTRAERSKVSQQAVGLSRRVQARGSVVPR
jgi:hypothetical protein